MNLKDLKYLVALADTGHFGKAAERTFVSQPTLSAQLKKLEEYLGVKLVERQPKNVQLTEVGKQVVVRARRMLDEGDEIIALGAQQYRSFRRQAQGGADPHHRALSAAARHAEDSQGAAATWAHAVRISNRGAAEAPARRRNRSGHHGAARYCRTASSRGMLYEEDFTVALPTHHPLAAKSTIKVQDLKGQTLLLLEDGHCLRDQALEVCSRVDVREAEDFRATSLETLRQMVVAGLGITLLPELAVESPFGSQRGLDHPAIQQTRAARTVGAVWRKSSTRAAAIAAVCDVVAASWQGQAGLSKPAARKFVTAVSAPATRGALYADHFTYSRGRPGKIAG